MKNIPGFKTSEKIVKEGSIVVCRGHQIEGDRQSVIIKTLMTKTANLTDAAKLMHEFEITYKLKVDGIIKPLQLEWVDDIPVIIMEDTGLVPLNKHLQVPLLHLPTLFSLTIQLVKILRELHQRGIVHGNLRPDNIFIEPVTGRLKITGFTMALLLTNEGQDSIKWDMPIETLPYMSPEQTGMLNRSIDYRSDYYSLGVVLYEILTGSSHLQVGNADEWRYAHVTQKPTHLRDINSEIPPVLADVILKLISKNPEGRYQSTGGLLKDIKKCQQQWTSTGNIVSFPLGQMDLPDCIINHSKLYGRKNEKETLQKALELVCAGQSGLILVHGFAGVGKTALVNGIIKPLAVKRGYYIYGKFDQLQTRMPYAPIIKAFDSLIRQLLTESREELQKWRKKLLEALGDNGRVISEVIPNLELIIGPQPPVEKLPPKETQNRFRLVFRNFIRVFAQRKQPLIVFIDDLHWADLASLQLITNLCGHQDSKYLLLIGAYRDNEVTEEHPLIKILAELQQTKILVQNIQLKPLYLDDTSKYIASVLDSSEEIVQPLVKLLFQKTAGNPFFLKQLLRYIYINDFITFNLKKGCWEWDLTSLEKLEMPDDVLHFLTGKLKMLPEKTRFLLEVAACIGNIFDIIILSGTCEMTSSQTISGLQPAVMEGLILPQNDFDSTLKIDEYEKYEFLHDCVRQAAYALLTEKRKKEIHYNIGLLILKNTTKDKLNEKITSIMDQINRGLKLVKGTEERIKFARYDLLAGKKAKNSGAYDSALSYHKAGTELLPENSWDKHYQLTYELYLEHSQCEYLCGHLDEAERLFDLILKHTRKGLEEANVYGLKMVLNSGVGNHLKAVQHGLTALRKIGYKLPSSPGKITFIKEIILFKLRMLGKTIDDLLQLPEIDQPLLKKAEELIPLMAPSANSISPELFALLCLKGANLSIKYGNSDLSSIGYAGYAVVICQVLRDYVAGNRFGELAIQLVERYDNKLGKSMVYFCVGSMVTPWTEHGKKGVDYLRKAVQYGLESGELTYTGYALQCIVEFRLILGDDLSDIYRESKDWYNFARRLNLDHSLADIILYQQLILELQGGTIDSENNSSRNFDREHLEEMLKTDNTILNTTYTCSRIIAAYLFGEYGNALTMADRVQKDIHSIEGFMLEAEYIFYYSLAISAEYYKLQKKEKKHHWKILKGNQRKMKRWAKLSKENFLHKYLLIEAEKARLKGRDNKISSLFDQAIESARENGYIQNEALGCELAARYYLSLKQHRIARVYLTDAYHAYCRWGGFKKAELLREQYPQILSGITAEKASLDSAEIMKNSLLKDIHRDKDLARESELEILRKATQNISVEEDSQKMELHYLKIVMESVGADRGYLILEKDGDLFIDAVGGNSQIEIINDPVILDDCEEIATTVVRYVARTNEIVVLNNSDDPGIFTGDPYLEQYLPKSILCLPVKMNNIPIGVLYLENTQVTGIFKLDRLEFLKLLSSHMAYVRKLEYLFDEDTTVEKGIVKQVLVESLTKRELEVLKLIMNGMSNKEIAQDLYLSINTVKMHIKNIYGKLGVHRRIQAVNKGKKLKLI